MPTCTQHPAPCYIPFANNPLRAHLYQGTKYTLPDGRGCTVVRTSIRRAPHTEHLTIEKPDCTFELMFPGLTRIITPSLRDRSLVAAAAEAEEHFTLDELEEATEYQRNRREGKTP